MMGESILTQQTKYRTNKVFKVMKINLNKEKWVEFS